MKTLTQLIKVLLVAAALSGGHGLAQEGPYILMKNGKSQPVQRIQAQSTGDLVVYLNGGRTVNVARDQYVRAVGVRPDSLDNANKLLAAGNADGAIPVYKGIVRDARFQSWDVVAGKGLVDANLAKKDGNAALAVVKQLKNRYGANAVEVYPDLELMEWRALIATGQGDSIEAQLNTIIRGKDRSRAARAQLVRGDIKAKKGLLEKANLDYLRTVIHFSKDSDIQPEALFKVAETFTALGKTGIAKRYSNQLKQEYPNSQFAARAERL